MTLDVPVEPAVLGAGLGLVFSGRSRRGSTVLMTRRTPFRDVEQRTGEKTGVNRRDGEKERKERKRKGDRIRKKGRIGGRS